MTDLTWNIDPVLLDIGGIQLHWYGALFAIALLCCYQIMKVIYGKEGRDVSAVDGLFIYAIVGAIAGARLGHCLFYEPQYYLANPLKILYLWEGGLASHGSTFGVVLSMTLYARKQQISFLWLMDRLAMTTALSSFLIRTGNFFNSEIIGIPTNVPWAVTFLRVDNLPRHPVQLYEAFTYLAIFLTLGSLYYWTKWKNQNGALFGLFLILMFATRIPLELYKVAQAAYISDLPLNTGQLLSIPFILAGLILLIYSKIRLKELHEHKAQ